MLKLIKQVFIALLNCSELKVSAFKWWIWMFRPTLIDLNPVKLKHYSLIISLDKCSRSCNVLSPKICLPKKKQKT